MLVSEGTAGKFRPQRAVPNCCRSKSLFGTKMPIEIAEIACEGSVRDANFASFTP
jgi:hypothetical protein